MSIKPIVLWGHATGPNPWKVAIALEELEVPYEHKFLQMSEMKQPPYEKVNPNGRVPAIEDPNTGLTIWESGACIDYLCETYDKSGKLTPSDARTKWAARSWRDFQMSGQGPPFGQYSWFINYHPEKVQSAIDRYKNEILRVMYVLDRQLSETKYLAGDRLTYADLMFLPWFLMAFKVPDVDLPNQFPAWAVWWEQLKSRPSVAKVWGDWMAARAESGKKD